MDQPADTESTPTAEEIQAVLARVAHRGYDAPPGDWIQNPRPIGRLDSVN